MFKNGGTPSEIEREERLGSVVDTLGGGEIGVLLMVGGTRLRDMDRRFLSLIDGGGVDFGGWPGTTGTTVCVDWKDSAQDTGLVPPGQIV